MRERRKPRSALRPLPPASIREFVPLLLILVLGLSLFFGIKLRDRETARDLEGAMTQVGKGVVTRVVIIRDDKLQGYETRVTLLELDGRTVNLNLADAAWANWLSKGQKVSYTYRVGHSGAWYLDQISPASQLSHGERR